MSIRTQLASRGFEVTLHGDTETFYIREERFLAAWVLLTQLNEPNIALARDIILVETDCDDAQAKHLAYLIETEFLIDGADIVLKQDPPRLEGVTYLGIFEEEIDEDGEVVEPSEVEFEDEEEDAR